VTSLALGHAREERHAGPQQQVRELPPEKRGLEL
jgi:hypothetical protein